MADDADNAGADLDPLAELEETVRQQRERLFAKRAARDADPNQPELFESPGDREPPTAPAPDETVSRPTTFAASPITESRPRPTPPAVPPSPEPPIRETRPAPPPPPPASSSPPEPRPTPAPPVTESRPAPEPTARPAEPARWPVTADSLEDSEHVGVGRTRVLLVIVAAVLGFATGAAGAAYYDRRDDSSAPRMPDAAAVNEADQTPSRSL